MNTYRLLRNIHLALALTFGLFLLMYGVSAVQMTHSSWFELKRTTTQSQNSLPPGLTARAVARLLMDRGLVRGELSDTSVGLGPYPNNMHLVIARPGVMYGIGYDLISGQVSITTVTSGFMGTINRLHHSAGQWHEYWLLNAWTALLALISLALIAIGGTGVYLWFARNQDRAIGYVLLGISLIFSSSVLILIRSAGP